MKHDWHRSTKPKLMYLGRVYMMDKYYMMTCIGRKPNAPAGHVTPQPYVSKHVFGTRQQNLQPD